MTDVPPSPGTGEKLAFFGAIAASLSHELKNVLATISEFSGLLDDLVLAAGAGRPLDSDRVQSICTKISTQIARGNGLVRGLNRFAHSVDEPAATVDLNRVVVEITDLARRFATLRQAKLETRLPDGPTTAMLDPFACQHAIFLGVTMALRVATKQRLVTVALESTAEAHRILVESGDPFVRPEPAIPELTLFEALAAQLGAEVDWIAEPGRDRLVLTTPRT